MFLINLTGNAITRILKFYRDEKGKNKIDKDYNKIYEKVKKKRKAVGGETEFELVLTTKATKEIAARYGGLENLGDKLMKSENFELALDEIVWLITLLANQSVLIHNLKNPDDKKEELTQETVELLTSPFELAGYKQAIMESLQKGTKQYIQSEDTQKNAVVE